MWRFVLVTNVLVIGRVSLQPITAETTQDGRQSRQLDISDCCPCPENADSTSKTSWRLEKTAGDGSLKTNLDDECPCLPRDSEGSSSMIFPTALRSGAATRLMDPKEDPKNLLEPEVGLASSVLETLRQATEEEYQDALARDAARANANDDAVPEESALNTVTIILPQRSVDDRDTEETLDSQNSQESKYLDPLGSTIKKQIQSKTYSGLNDILRLPQVERLTFLQKKLLNVGNGVSTSKFLERNEETTNKAPMLKSPLTNQERDRTEFFEDQGQSIIHQSDDSEALNKEQCNFSTKIIESMKIKKAEGVENDLDLAASDINANVARSQDEFESIEMTKATANKNPLFHNSLILRELPKRIQLVDKMNGKMNLKQISASQQDYRKSILSDLTNNGLKFDINKRKWIDFKDTENEEEDTVQSSRQRQEEEVAQPTNEYKTMDLSNESDTMNDTEGKLLNDSSFENLNEEAQKFINSNEISSENFSRSQNSEEILNTELLNTLFQVAPNRDHSNWNKGTRVNDSHTTNKHNTSNIFHEEDIKDSIQNDMIPENTEIKTVVLDKLSKTVPKYINRNEKNVHSADEKPEFSNNIPLLQDKFIKNSLINQNVLSDSTQENPERSLLSNVIEAQNTFNENYELQNKSGVSKIDKNNVSREMSMNDLQDLSDTLLKLSIAGENGAKDENNLVCEKWSEASRASLPKPNDATIVVNNLQSDLINKDDLQNDEGDTSIKDSTKARVSNQPEKENRSRILSVGADPVEMTAEGSNPIMSSIQRNPFDYLRDNNFKSALSVDKVVQPNFDLFRSETGTGLILPTLDNIKEKVTQFFSPHDRESEKEQIDCVRESQMITAEESSPMSRSRSPLAPLEDVNLDIFQLKPLTLPNYFPKNIPRVDLKTYRAKLPIPKNLGMKPLIFESSLGNREGLIGTAFSVGPQSKSRFHEIYATPMPNLPGLQEIRENLKLHTTNLLQNPINFNRGSIFEPDILSITDNLRQRAEDTLADMKEKIESSLYGVNSMDVFGDSLRSHDILEKLTGTRDDFSEKLKGIQYDLNDRLTSFQEQLLDKTRLMSKSKLLFKDKQSGNLRSSPHSLNVNSKVKKVSRLNDDKSTKLGASRLNHVDSGKMKKFRMPTAASVPIPYSIQVPELKMAYIDPPVNSPDRQQNFSRLSDLLSRSAALRDSTQNTKIKKIGAKKENKFKVSFTPLSNENSDNRKSLGSVTDTNESLSALVPLKVRDSEINSKLKSMEYEEDLKELTRGDEDKLKFQHKFPYFSKAQSIESDKGSSLSRNSLSSSNYKANKLLTSTSWPNTEEYSFLSKVRNNIKEKLSKLDSSLKINRNKPFNDHTIYESYEQMVNDEASENTNVASQSFGIKSPISFRSQRIKDNDEKVMDADESPSQVAPIRSQYPNTCMEQKIVAISDDSDSLRQAQEGNETIVKPKLPKIKYPIKTSGRVMGLENREIEPSESLSDNKPLRSRAKQLLVTMNSPVFRQELNSEDTEEIPTTTVQTTRPKIKYPLKTRSRVQATHESESNESSLKTRKHNMPDKLEVSFFRQNPDSEQMDDRITTTAKPSLPKIKYPLKTKGRAHDSEGTETDGSPLQSQVPEIYTRLKVPVFRDEHNSEEIEECPTTTARPPLPKIKYPLKNKGRIHDIEGIETNGSPLESRVLKLYTRLKSPVFREEPDSEQIDDPTTTTAKPQLPKIKYPIKTKARVQDIEGTEADGSLLESRGPEMYTRLRVPVFRDENNSEDIEECATTAMPQLPKIKYPMKTKGRLQNIEDMDPYVSPSKIVSLKAPAKEPCTEIKRPVFRHEDSTEETKDIPTTTAKPRFPKIKYPLKTRSGIQNTEDTEINRNPLNHRIKELYNRLKAPVWRDDHGSEEITESAITTVKPQVPKIKYPLKTKSRVQEIEQIDPNGSLTISVPLKTRVEDLYNRLKIPVFRDKQNSERQSELQRETEETVTTTAKPHVPKIKYPLKTKGRHQNLEDRESNGNIPIRGTSVVLREEEENPKKQQCYTQATTVKPIQVINHIKYPLWNIKPSSAENDDTHTDPQDSVRSSDKDESIKQRLSKTWPKPADSSFLTKVREAVKERLSKLDPTKILDENVYNKPKARSFDMERSPTENHAIIFKSAEELPSTRPTTKMPKIKYPIQGRLQNLQHDDFSPSDSLQYSGMDLTRKKIPSLTWPTKTEENSLLTKLRDAVKERLSKFDPSHLSENLPAKLDPENEMERSGSENVGIIAPDALKENVSYKCRMVCTKEN